MKTVKLLTLIPLLYGSPLAMGQGAIVVNPLSQFTINPAESIAFSLHNRQDGEVKLRFLVFCQHPGGEQSGEACKERLDWKVEGLTGDTLIIPKGGRAEGEVKLKKTDGNYILFKPLIEPVVEKVPGKTGVGFQFKYQPGYLFIIKPSKEQISKEKVKLTSVERNGEKRINAKFDIAALTEPQVLSFNAKVVEKASKKLVRFITLANNKIVDPHRKILELEEAYAKADFKEDVCAQIIIEAKASKEVYKIDTCE